MTKKLLDDLACVRDHLQRFGAKSESVLPGTALVLAGDLDRVRNSLAARLQPARLIIALRDPVDGMDQNPLTIVGSTVPVTVFVVDHRTNHLERVVVVSSGELGEPSEVIEVVSDEAADYLNNAEWQKRITSNC